jgi:hypothetical protein
MANLKNLTANQPMTIDQITFDPRTQQWHDIANRYRMVKKSIVESLQIENQIQRNKTSGYVTQTIFDAFRNDVYRHISDTANLIRQAVESLKASLQNQIIENRRLEQEIYKDNTIIPEKVEKTSIKSSNEKTGTFLSSFLGLSGLGITGFIAASYFMTPNQIQRFGEVIDDTIDMIPDLESAITVFQELNNIFRRVSDFFERLTNINMGDTVQRNIEEAEIIPGAALARRTGRAIGEYTRAAFSGETSSIPSGNVIPSPNASNNIAVSNEGQNRPVLPIQQTREMQDREMIRTSYREERDRTRQEAAVGELERAPSHPERTISNNLFNNESLDQIRQMRYRQGQYSGLSEEAIRERIIPMIQTSLERPDRNEIANRIMMQIGTRPELYNSGQIARDIITSATTTGTRRAAELLYDTFYTRQVTGVGVGGQTTTSTRRNELQRRLQIARRGIEIQSNQPNIPIPPIPSSQGGVSVGISPPIGGNNRQNQQIPQAQRPQVTQPTGPIQTRNSEPTAAAGQAVARGATQP